jgi:hypothetical protein
MAKIKLGARPESFKHTVKFPMLDGTQGTIEVHYRYRTRKAFGAFIDSVFESANEPQVDGTKPNLADIMAKTAGANASYIMQAVVGWNLDEDFTEENVQQLADEIPAAAAAIMNDYQKAILEGKLGN